MASLEMEVASVSVSFDSLEEREDAQEIHYLLVTKSWVVQCIASEAALVAKVSFYPFLWLQILVQTFHFGHPASSDLQSTQAKFAEDATNRPHLGLKSVLLVVESQVYISAPKST